MMPNLYLFSSSQAKLLRAFPEVLIMIKGLLPGSTVET